MSPRTLTDGENSILKMIQEGYGPQNTEGYGPQNTEDKVFFTKTDEAALFVRAADGTSPLMANLTNLPKWREDGTILSDESLKVDCLRIK